MTPKGHGRAISYRIIIISYHTPLTAEPSHTWKRQA